MSDTLNEQLSAFLDGELPPEETDLLLKRLARDPDLRARLGRYGLVGDTLRGERTRASGGFALRVSAALAAEPALEPVAAPAAVAPEPAPAPAAAARTARGGLPRWFRPVAGFAVAATVAGMAVFVLQRDPALTGEAPVAQVATTAAAPTVPAAAPAASIAPAAALPSNGEPASYVTPPAGRAGVAPIPPAQLANYVVAHSEYSSPLGRRNVLTGLIAGESQAVPPAADAAAPETTAPGRAPVAVGTP